MTKVVKRNVYQSRSKFKGYVDLSEFTFTGHTDQSRSTFKGSLDLSDCNFQGPVDQSRSTFMCNLFMYRARLEGPWYMDSALIVGGLHLKDIEAAGFGTVEEKGTVYALNRYDGTIEPVGRPGEVVAMPHVLGDIVAGRDLPDWQMALMRANSDSLKEAVAYARAGKENSIKS